MKREFHVRFCESLKGRFLRATRPLCIYGKLSGGVEVLMTNLMDSEKYNASLFKSLYHLRWGIEENYKRLKQWVEIENFSGKSALSVQQDFYAKIVASNLTALMAMAAQKTIATKTKHLKLKYQITMRKK